MEPTVSIGTQSFEFIRQENAFYIDKTGFIREWWEGKDAVTLITRPRRFGKTLNMSMLDCFFSSGHAADGCLFEGLSIWEHEKYRMLQGTYPVISLSFAGIKANHFQGAKNGLVRAMAEAYDAHKYLKDSDCLSQEEKYNYDAFRRYSSNPSPDKEIDDQFVTAALNTLSGYLEHYYGKKVLIFLDEYDTPLQEAYVSGYWKELVLFVRELFNLTFKDNRYLERAVLTGITRVGKESIFSDLNNLQVVTTTSDKYTSWFGFTEAEVFAVLERRGLSAEKDNIRFWYDGFTFGSRNDMYNPWSITKYLDLGKYGTYWADTSSNILVSELIRQGTPELKMQMEELLAGRYLETVLDEQIVFDQLNHVRGAIWSLLVAAGYLKPVNCRFDPEQGETIYRLGITNHETMLMFRKMISGWFPEDLTSYRDFQKALLAGDLDYMNQFMNDISTEVFSSFDAGRKASDKAQPERFYHGFVLGLVVDMAGRYYIRSNRQSGLGRYDVIMEPKNRTDHAIVMEFKVFSLDRDRTMEAAVDKALKQLENMKYDTELLARGISREQIRHYGFVFDGQKVLIGEPT